MEGRSASSRPFDVSARGPRPKQDRYVFVPVATVGLILILCLIFFVEINSAFELDSFLSPSRQALIALGAIDGHLVFDSSEWWRVFTAPMLHSGLFHLISNCAVLALVGWSLEPLIGPSWFVAIFAISAIGGSFGSMAQNDAQLVSVGASGAISGLLATAFVASARTNDLKLRRRMRMIALRILIPATLPAAISASANHGHVDYGAHMGGAIAGALAAILLHVTWNNQTRRPALPRLALAISCAFGVAVSAAFATTLSRAPIYVAEKPQFIPKRDYRDGPEAIKHASEWITQYPNDPRGYYFKALDYLDHRDAPNAVADLRVALARYDANQAIFTPAFGHSIKLVLALAIKANGNLESAHVMAQDSCNATDAPQRVLELAKKEGVCP